MARRSDGEGSIRQRRHGNLSTTADIYANLTTDPRRRMADTMDRILTG